MEIRGARHGEHAEKRELKGKQDNNHERVIMREEL